MALPSASTQPQDASPPQRGRKRKRRAEHADDQQQPPYVALPRAQAKRARKQLQRGDLTNAPQVTYLMSKQVAALYPDVQASPITDGDV